MTGRLYVNTASNEIIGDLGIIMDRMAVSKHSSPGWGNGGVMNRGEVCGELDAV